jgi:DNA-binding response OmpR family regulator
MDRLRPEGFDRTDDARPQGAAIDIERVLELARILVVDDDEQAAMLVRTRLERYGFRHVQTTQDPERAVSLTSERLPDVLVLDVHMPQLDGLGVLREIQRRETARMRPGIVALSGDASPATRRAMLAGGADDFILRPCPGPELARRVARVAQRIWGERRALLRPRRFEPRTNACDYLEGFDSG